MIGLSCRFIKYGHGSVAGEVGNANLSHINLNQRYSENIGVWQYIFGGSESIYATATSKKIVKLS